MIMDQNLRLVRNLQIFELLETSPRYDEGEV
jgi:hypothetical protein